MTSRINNMETFNDLYSNSSQVEENALSSSDLSIFSPTNNAQTVQKSSLIDVDKCVSNFNEHLISFIKKLNELNQKIIKEKMQEQEKKVVSDVTTFSFNTQSVEGFYDANNDTNCTAFSMKSAKKDIPKMWSEYGDLFKKVGEEMDVDPYALAAFCVFESYSSKTGTFYTKMYEKGDGMIAVGIGATQAKDVAGTKIPGLNKSFPKSTSETIEVLKANPEYSLRSLAQEFKVYYNQYQDLAKVFPKVAQGDDWAVNNSTYGTKAQYISRAYVLYNLFKNADSNAQNPTS